MNYSLQITVQFLRPLRERALKTLYSMLETSALTKEAKTVTNPNMVFIPGGQFLMGSDKFYPEEKPVRQVTVDGFYIDKYEVTNVDYKKFVQDTGYVTVAERPLNPADYP